MRKINCRVCGSPFKIYSGQDLVHCEAHRGTQGRKGPRVPQVVLVCYCGEKFTVPRYESGRKFCPACRQNRKTGVPCTPEQLLRASKEFELWRKAVLQRDIRTCQKCGEREGKICAHHIISIKERPDLAFVVENGLTVCHVCHNKAHYADISAGQERRKIYSPEVWDLWVNLYQKGYSTPQIAQAYKCSEPVVVNRIIECGCALRTRGDSIRLSRTLNLSKLIGTTGNS